MALFSSKCYKQSPSRALLDRLCLWHFGDLQRAEAYGREIEGQFDRRKPVGDAGPRQAYDDQIDVIFDGRRLVKSPLLTHRRLSSVFGSKTLRAHRRPGFNFLKKREKFRPGRRPFRGKILEKMRGKTPSKMVKPLFGGGVQTWLT